MNKSTFANIEKSISPERLAVYKTDGASNETALARYKGMATHSSILTWGIPWTEEPGLQRLSD